MIPRGCVLKGYRDVFTPAAVRAYRHYGFVIVEDFFDAPTVRQLAALCNEVARRRGDNIFPGLDPEHQHGATQRMAVADTPAQPPTTYSSSAAVGSGGAAAGMSASAGRSTGSGQRSAEAGRRAPNADHRRRADGADAKLPSALKERRSVDRAFRKLTRMRDRCNAYKNMRQHASAVAELSGANAGQPQQLHTHEDLPRSFAELYDRGSARDQAAPHDHSIMEAMRFMQGFPRAWAWLWPSSPALAALVASATGGVGRRLGEAAGQLSGEVVLRAYGDTAAQDVPLTNAPPMGFGASGGNVAHPHALSAQVGLAQRGTMTQLLMPGSQHVIRQISRDGAELQRFAAGGAFDVGSVVRRLPELRHLPVVEVPPLRPGAVLLVNNYVVMGVQPTLTGPACAAKRGTVATAPVTEVSVYSLSLIPDRCAFDGEPSSWASRDSHGPLFGYKRGDLLTDDTKFPVIHRALDIE